MKFNPSKFKIIDQKKFVKESFIHKYKRLILTFLQKGKKLCGEIFLFFGGGAGLSKPPKNIFKVYSLKSRKSLVQRLSRS